MARFSAVLAIIAVLATEAAAFPINPRTLANRNLAKRIAQTTIDAPKKWEDACTAAGGADKCNPIAVTAAATLLAAAGPCEQQDSGDAMVDLAKQLNNNQAMITAAQIFIQQPRNSPNSVATVYCQTAPKNDELAGFFQCQFQSADQTKFSNGQAAGSSGTVPLGLTALNPAGSCPANPNGPIADGSQLSDIASSPGTPATGSGAAASGSGNSTATATASASTSTSASGSDSGDDSGDDDDCGDGTATVTVAPSTTAAISVATSAPAAITKAAGGASGTASAASSTSTAASFVLQNGLDAQKQNLDSLSIKSTDSCDTDGSFACVQGEVMQCANSAWAGMGNCTASSNANTSCFFLPFIAKASVSTPSCVTTDIAETRIAASGATGGIFGNGAKAEGTVPLSTGSK